MWCSPRERERRRQALIWEGVRRKPRLKKLGRAEHLRRPGRRMGRGVRTRHEGMLSACSHNGGWWRGEKGGKEVQLETKRLTRSKAAQKRSRVGYGRKRVQRSPKGSVHEKDDGTVRVRAKRWRGKDCDAGLGDCAAICALSCIVVGRAGPV